MTTLNRAVTFDNKPTEVLRPVANVAGIAVGKVGHRLLLMAALLTRHSVLENGICPSLGYSTVLDVHLCIPTKTTESLAGNSGPRLSIPEANV